MIRYQCVLAFSACLCLASSSLQAKPEKALAIWAFDGTVLDGDCAAGLVRDGKTYYEGLIAAAIRAGFAKDYKGVAGAKAFLSQYNYKIRSGRVQEAYEDGVKIFAGADEKKLRQFCEGKFQSLQMFYFNRSMQNLKKLSNEGVENHIISTAPEVFVQAASKTVGIPVKNIHGVKVLIRNGKLTNRIIRPFPHGQGKIDIMRRLERQRRGKVLYGFGNSYGTDGKFLLAIAKQGGQATMINGGQAHPGMTEHFVCENYERPQPQGR